MATKKIYAVIDVETTGGRAARERITEIAIVLFDGEKILDTFSSLLNPERVIPYNITQLTGITQEMVEEAPKFYEVAKQIVEMTEGAIFVAHNARFDYSFIREEFKRLGYNYSRRQLCTVRLCRKTFPGLRSYSLGKLTQYFGIAMDRRHRALDDTLATVELLKVILQKQNSDSAVNELVNMGIRATNLPENISLERLHQLPEACGVYYFHDQFNKLLYVGKSINIKKRVMQHFANKNKKGHQLQQQVHDISYEITGSELVALLQESHEIKQYHPPINRAQRQRVFQYVIHYYANEQGYFCLDIAKAGKLKKKKLNVLREYPTILSAKTALNRIIETFELCQSYCNVDHIGRPCFYYHLHKCRGACIGEELPLVYNERIMEAVASLGTEFDDNFFILDKGRNPQERAVVLVENGAYQGFGYVDEEGMSGGVEELRDAIQPFQHNPDTVRIIRHFLLRNEQRLEIIRF